MKKATAAVMAILLCMAALACPVRASQSGDDLLEQASAGLSALGGEKGALLRQGADFPAGTSVCDWVAIALALSGSPEDYATYLRDLQSYVEVCYAENGGLDRVKATTYHRIALTVLALGGDPENFGKKPDGTPIDLIADGTYAFAGDSLGKQGLNGWIYGLLTLDASGVRVPEDAKFSRETMIQSIVEAQESDGGFGLASGSSNVDITAMALQALAPYQQAYPQVIENGLSYLSKAMDGNCLYTAFGAESAESSAQVILALCALGIDPQTDSRFCRGSRTLLTGLAGFVQPDGTFGHTMQDTKGDFLATAQSLLALTALQKLRDGQGWIFDFSNYPSLAQSRGYGIYYGAAGVGAALIICIVIAGKRKNYGKKNG